MPLENLDLTSYGLDSHLGVKHKPLSVVELYESENPVIDLTDSSGTLSAEESMNLTEDRSMVTSTLQSHLSQFSHLGQGQFGGVKRRASISCLRAQQSPAPCSGKLNASWPQTSFPSQSMKNLSDARLGCLSANTLKLLNLDPSKYQRPATPVISKPAPSPAPVPVDTNMGLLKIANRLNDAAAKSSKKAPKEDGNTSSDDCRSPVAAQRPFSPIGPPRTQRSQSVEPQGPASVASGGGFSLMKWRNLPDRPFTPPLRLPARARSLSIEKEKLISLSATVKNIGDESDSDLPSAQSPGPRSRSVSDPVPVIPAPVCFSSPLALNCRGDGSVKLNDQQAFGCIPSESEDEVSQVSCTTGFTLSDTSTSRKDTSLSIQSADRVMTETEDSATLDSNDTQNTMESVTDTTLEDTDEQKSTTDATDDGSETILVMTDSGESLSEEEALRIVQEVMEQQNSCRGDDREEAMETDQNEAGADIIQIDSEPEDASMEEEKSLEKGIENAGVNKLASKITENVVAAEGGQLTRKTSSPFIPGMNQEDNGHDQQANVIHAAHKTDASQVSKKRFLSASDKVVDVSNQATTEMENEVQNEENKSEENLIPVPAVTKAAEEDLTQTEQNITFRIGDEGNENSCVEMSIDDVDEDDIEIIAIDPETPQVTPEDTPADTPVDENITMEGDLVNSDAESDIVDITESVLKSVELKERENIGLKETESKQNSLCEPYDSKVKQDINVDPVKKEDSLQCQQVDRDEVDGDGSQASDVKCKKADHDTLPPLVVDTHCPDTVHVFEVSQSVDNSCINTKTVSKSVARIAPFRKALTSPVRYRISDGSKDGLCIMESSVMISLEEEQRCMLELPVLDPISKKIKEESIAKSCPGERGPFKCCKCKREYRTESSYKLHADGCNFCVSSSDEESGTGDSEIEGSVMDKRVTRAADRADSQERSESKGMDTDVVGKGPVRRSGRFCENKDQLAMPELVSAAALDGLGGDGDSQKSGRTTRGRPRKSDSVESRGSNNADLGSGTRMNSPETRSGMTSPTMSDDSSSKVKRARGRPKKSESFDVKSPAVDSERSNDTGGGHEFKPRATRSKIRQQEQATSATDKSVNLEDTPHASGTAEMMEVDSRLERERLVLADLVNRKRQMPRKSFMDNDDEEISSPKAKRKFVAETYCEQVEADEDSIDQTDGMESKDETTEDSNTVLIQTTKKRGRGRPKKTAPVMETEVTLPVDLDVEESCEYLDPDTGLLVNKKTGEMKSSFKTEKEKIDIDGEMSANEKSLNDHNEKEEGKCEGDKDMSSNLVAETDNKNMASEHTSEQTDSSKAEQKLLCESSKTSVEKESQKHMEVNDNLCPVEKVETKDVNTIGDHDVKSEDQVPDVKEDKHSDNSPIQSEMNDKDSDRTEQEEASCGKSILLQTVSKCETSVTANVAVSQTEEPLPFKNNLAECETEDAITSNNSDCLKEYVNDEKDVSKTVQEANAATTKPKGTVLNTGSDVPDGSPPGPENIVRNMAPPNLPDTVLKLLKDGHKVVIKNPKLGQNFIWQKTDKGYMGKPFDKLPLLKKITDEKGNVRYEKFTEKGVIKEEQPKSASDILFKKKVSPSQPNDTNKSATPGMTAVLQSSDKMNRARTPVVVSKESFQSKTLVTEAIQKVLTHKIAASTGTAAIKPKPLPNSSELLYATPIPRETGKQISAEYVGGVLLSPPRTEFQLDAICQRIESTAPLAAQVLQNRMNISPAATSQQFTVVQGVSLSNSHLQAQTPMLTQQLTQGTSLSTGFTPVQDGFSNVQPGYTTFPAGLINAQNSLSGVGTGYIVQQANMPTFQTGFNNLQTVQTGFQGLQTGFITGNIGPGFQGQILSSTGQMAVPGMIISQPMQMNLSPAVSMQTFSQGPVVNMTAMMNMPLQPLAVSQPTISPAQQHVTSLGHSYCHIQPSPPKTSQPVGSQNICVNQGLTLGTSQDYGLSSAPVFNLQQQYIGQSSSLAQSLHGISQSSNPVMSIARTSVNSQTTERPRTVISLSPGQKPVKYMDKLQSLIKKRKTLTARKSYSLKDKKNKFPFIQVEKISCPGENLKLRIVSPDPQKKTASGNAVKLLKLKKKLIGDLKPACKPKVGRPKKYTKRKDRENIAPKQPIRLAGAQPSVYFFTFQNLQKQFLILLQLVKLESSLLFFLFNLKASSYSEHLYSISQFLFQYLYFANVQTKPRCCTAPRRRRRCRQQQWRRRFEMFRCQY